MDQFAIDYLQQAITLMEKENYEGAISLADKALGIEPRYTEAYSVKADALVNLENYEGALEVYNKALLIDPKDGEIYFNIGSIYILLDDIVKCLKNYNKADQLGFNSYELYKNLADIYRQLGKSDLALVNYNKAIFAEPLRADIRLEKAGFQITQVKFNEALETLEELQALEPDLYDAIVMRAEIYNGLGQFDKAMEIIEKAIKDFPEDAALMVEKAKMLVGQGKADLALEVINSLKTMDNFPMVDRAAYLVEAQIYALKGDLAKAKNSIWMIIENSEEFDAEAEYLYLTATFALQEYDKALQTAIKLSESDEDTLYTLSGKFFYPQILQRLGRNDEAMSEYRKLTGYFRKVTVNNPHFYEVYMYRLLCHKELKEYDRALELADYIQNLKPDSSDAYAMKYAIYKDMNQMDKAEEMKKIVAKLNPQLQL